MVAFKNRSRACRIGTILTSILIVLAIVVPIIVHFAKTIAAARNIAAAKNIAAASRKAECENEWISEPGYNTELPQGLFDVRYSENIAEANHKKCWVTRIDANKNKWTMDKCKVKWVSHPDYELPEGLLDNLGMLGEVMGEKLNSTFMEQFGKTHTNHTHPENTTDIFAALRLSALVASIIHNVTESHNKTMTNSHNTTSDSTLSHHSSPFGILGHMFDWIKNITPTSAHPHMSKEKSHNATFNRFLHVAGVLPDLE